MEKFTSLTGIAATLPVANINTDAIIPARWMTAIDANLSKGLFGGWRYDENDEERADFVLNREPFRRSCILVAGENFGCGSSREQAVWSLLRFGISCVIAPSFADIFYENCYKNGLLPLILPADTVQGISDALAAAASPTLTVDLEHCRVALPDGTATAFTIDDTRRRALLQGKDEIDLTLDYDAQISSFQQADRSKRPWIYARELPAAAPVR